LLIDVEVWTLTEKQRFVAFNLETGTMVLGGKSGKSPQIVDLVARYAAAGRRVSALADSALAWIGR